MNRKDRQPEHASELRQQAEEYVQHQDTEAEPPFDVLTPAATQQLIHELQVHQIELELQNEELRRTQQELVDARKRYFDLYELAPVGYVTLTEQGLILQANLTAATLLAVTRHSLAQQPLSRFIHPDDQDDYYRYLRRLSATCTLQTCELRLLRQSGTPFWAVLRATWLHAETEAEAATIHLALDDVSERKQAELQLQASERELRGILDSLQEVYYRSDLEGRLTRISASAEALFGLTPAQSLGTPITNYWYHPEQRQQLLNALQQGDGMVWDYQIQALHQDGTPFWVSLNTHFHYDAQGRVAGVEGTLRDITENKRWGRELARFKALLDQTHDAVFIMQPDTLRFTYVNQGAVGQTGYRSDELLQMTPAELAPEYDAARLHALLSPLMAGNSRTCSFDTRYQTKDQRTTYVEVMLQRLQMPEEEPVVVAIVRDISERRQAFQALREERDNAQRYLDTVEAIIVALDESGRITLINRRGCELLGYDERELVGKDWFSTCIPPSAIEQGVGRVFEQIMAGNLDSTEYFENKIITRGGEERIISWHNSLLHNARGDIVCSLSAGEDITERRRIEASDRQHLEELAHYSRLSTMGEMSSQIAHELNQPLTAIATTSDALGRLFDTDPTLPPHEIRDALRDITSQAQRAGEIIRHLRGFARKHTTQRQPHQLTKLISDVLQLLNIDLRRHNIGVEQHHSDPSLTINCDKILIEQVILNLLRNAVEAITASPGTQRRVRITTALLDNDRVEVCFHDTGPGLPPQELSSVFEPYYTTKQNGMGMGLSISRTLIESHGGKLWAYSTPGEGCTFCFTLPLTRGGN